MTNTIKTPQDMKRATLGMIASVCDDIAQYAMDQDEAKVRTQFWYLKAQMDLLETINNLLIIPK